MDDLPPTACREIGRPIARELAEMLLIRIDLANSLASLRAWAEGYVPDPQQEDERTGAIRGSLFRDGVTQFVACFDGSHNAHPLVVENVFPNVEGIAPYVRWLRDLRTSYGAHRYGSARQCVVGAFINPNSGEYLGRGELFGLYKGPSPEGHANLLSLIEMTIRYADGRIEALRKEFDAEAGAIPPAELLKLPIAAIQPQGPTTMAKSRGDISKGIARESDSISAHFDQEVTGPKLPRNPSEESEQP